MNVSNAYRSRDCEKQSNDKNVLPNKENTHDTNRIVNNANVVMHTFQTKNISPLIIEGNTDEWGKT